MAGILGDLFGLGGTQAPTPGLLDAAGYMDPAQYDRMRQSQSMMGLWAGLLAGGGPSLSPRNFGSALGAGLTGAQQFGSQFDESQLHGAQAAQARANALKLADDVRSGQLGRKIAQEEIDRNRSGGGTPGSSSPAAPGAGSSTPNFGAGSPGARATSSTTANADLPPEARAFLDTVAGPESGGAYNARWPGTTFSGYDDHPRIYSPGPQGPSSAAGRYEIVASTWDDLNKKYNFPDFKPETQDLAAWKLAEDTYRSRTGGDLSAALKEGKLQEVQQMLKGQWGTLNMANYGANLRKYTGGDGDGTATAGVAPVPGALAQVPSYSGALGERAAPMPAVLAAPGVNPDAPAPPGAGAALRTGRTVLPPGRGLVTPQDYADWQASGRIPSGPVNVGPNAGVPGAPVNVRALAGEAAPAGPVAEAPIPPPVAAAAAPVLVPGGRAPMPAVLAAPASPASAPAPIGALPPAAAPPPGATVPPGAATAPGDLYPGLPAIPPAAALPTPMTPPQPVSRTGGPVAVPALPGPAAGATTSGLTPEQLQQSRSAQNLELAFGLMKIPVPDFLKERAKLEAGGQLAAAQEAATQPYKFQMKLYEDALQNRRDQYNAMDKTQQEQYAASLGMQRDQVKSGFDIIADRIKQQTAAALAGPTAGAQEQARMDVQARTSPGIKYNEELLAGAGKQTVEQRAKALSSAQALATLDDTKEQLRGSGIFTGYGANTKLTLAQIGAAAGWSNEKIANTQTYLNLAGQAAIEILRSGAFGSGTGISEGDRRAAERLANGDTTLDLETIKRVMDISERRGYRNIETFNDQIKRHPQADQLRVESPPRLTHTTPSGGRVYTRVDGSQFVRE